MRSAAFALGLRTTFACMGLIAAAGCFRERVETSACALAPAVDGATRVLFIGNSYTYTNNLPEVLEGIAAANDARIETGLVAAGGLSLDDHAASEEATSAIRDGAWDYVVLQEQSSFGEVFLIDGNLRVRPSTSWRAGAETLSRLSRHHGATPILLAHWSRRDSPEDQATIDRNVADGAAAIGACFLRLAPARDVAERALGRAAFYDEDGSHPSPLASYLAAAVVARAISDDELAVAPLSHSGERIETEDGARTGETATLFSLAEHEAEIVRDAVNRSAPEAVAPTAAAPVEILLPQLVETDEAPTAARVRGTWLGELALYPIPASLRLDFTEEGNALVADVSVRGGDNERRVARTRVVIEGTKLRFAFPEGPNGTSIDFVGVLDGEEKLAGSAHFRSESGDLEGYGSWRAGRAAPRE